MPATERAARALGEHGSLARPNAHSHQESPQMPREVQSHTRTLKRAFWARASVVPCCVMGRPALGCWCRVLWTWWPTVGAAADVPIGGLAQHASSGVSHRKMRGIVARHRDFLLDMLRNGG